jgi:hypothetical protein
MPSIVLATEPDLQGKPVCSIGDRGYWFVKTLNEGAMLALSSRNTGDPRYIICWVHPDAMLEMAPPDHEAANTKERVWVVRSSSFHRNPTRP